MESIYQKFAVQEEWNRNIEARVYNAEIYARQLQETISGKITEILNENQSFILREVKDGVSINFNKRLDNISEQQSSNLNKIMAETSKSLSESRAIWTQALETRAKEQLNAIRSTKESFSAMLEESNKRIDLIKDSSEKSLFEIESKISRIVTPDNLSIAINHLRGELIKQIEENVNDKASTSTKIMERISKLENYKAPNDKCGFKEKEHQIMNAIHLNNEGIALLQKNTADNKSIQDLLNEVKVATSKAQEIEDFDSLLKNARENKITFDSIHQTLEEIKTRDSKQLIEVDKKVELAIKRVELLRNVDAQRNGDMKELKQTSIETIAKVDNELNRVKAQMLRLEEPTFQDLDYERVQELIKEEVRKAKETEVRKSAEDKNEDNPKDAKYLIAWNSKTLKVKNSQLKAHGGNIAEVFNAMALDIRPVSSEAKNFTKQGFIEVKNRNRNGWTSIPEEKLLNAKGDVYALLQQFRDEANKDKGSGKQESGKNYRKKNQNQNSKPKPKRRYNGSMGSIQNAFTQILRVLGGPVGGGRGNQ